MSEIAAVIARYGFPTACGAVLLFLVLRGEFEFRYPRKRRLPARRNQIGTSCDALSDVERRRIRKSACC